MPEVLLRCSGGLISTTVAYWLREREIGFLLRPYSSTTADTALRRNGPLFGGASQRSRLCHHPLGSTFPQY